MTEQQPPVQDNHVAGHGIRWHADAERGETEHDAAR